MENAFMRNKITRALQIIHSKKMPKQPTREDLIRHNEDFIDGILYALCAYAQNASNDPSSAKIILRLLSTKLGQLADAIPDQPVH